MDTLQGSSADSAVMLPKLPVKIDLGVPCDETRGSVYYAYADEAIYNKLRVENS